MGIWLEKQPINRAVYALLHLYLFFLLVCGVYAWAITGIEICRNRQVFKDLFMIAIFKTRKYQAVQDLEAQRGFSSTNRIDAEAETPSTGEIDGNIAAAAFVNESERGTEDDDDPGIDPSVGECITRTVFDPTRYVDRGFYVALLKVNMNRNVKEAARPLSPLDSDGDAITMTPSSPSSSTCSSGIDELEYVDDEDDRHARRGVRLRQPLGHRKRRDTNPSNTIDKRGCPEEDEYDDLKSLYYATPCLSPQDHNAKTDLEPLDIGEPHSPCESCSSAHAESIPTAKRSPARVPITPTSPTADADDADTEKTDVELKQRERKSRIPTTSALPNPIARTKTSKNLPQHDTTIPLPGTEQQERAAASARTFGKLRSKSSPMSAPAFPTRRAAPPRDREAGLFWRSREADGSGSAASWVDKAQLVSFDDVVMVDTPAGMQMRDIQSPVRSSLLPKRPATPYPLAEGVQAQATGLGKGRGVRELSIEIPDVGVGSEGEEGGQ